MPVGLFLPCATGLGLAARAARQVDRAAEVTEGIYVVVAKSGLTYVGQSRQIGTRLLQHVATGKITPAAARSAQRIYVPAGRATREWAEQLKIRDLGGIRVLENKLNPIGKGRARLEGAFESLDEYLNWLGYHLQ